jgi:hypothetical protein
MEKQITAIASAFRKAQKRGYKGTLAAWLQTQFPSYASTALEEAVAKKVSAYDAQAAAYAAR